MTIIELEESLRNLKVKDVYCNLFKEYHSTPTKAREVGLYVAENHGVWEAYDIERASKELACVFDTESDLYEYVQCYFKKISDVDYWFDSSAEGCQQKLMRRIRHFRIPESLYSFNGGIAKDCLCVEQEACAWKVYYSDGIERVSHGIFYYPSASYDFLFYLLMKKHVNIRKHWW